MNLIDMNAPAVKPDKITDMMRYYDLAHEICVRVDHDKSRLTDDERITLSVVAAQAALARHLTPNDLNAEAVLNKVLRVLDHQEMIAAMTRKMHRLLEESEYRRPYIPPTLNY
jgi:hypothetical protein